MVSKTKDPKIESKKEKSEVKTERLAADKKEGTTDLKEGVADTGEKLKKKRGKRSMMDEQKRKDVKGKLTEEERVRSLKEGGETMRAQLAMEEGERAAREGSPGRESYLVSEEERERRRLAGTGDPYRGYGETQRGEMAMWDTKAPPGKSLTEEEMRRTGSARVGYESGTGSYYSEMPDRPTGTAGPESSFGRTERTPSGRQYAEGGKSEGAGTPTAQEIGSDVMAKTKATGSTMVAKTKEISSGVTEKAKEYTEGTKAEDSAHRAGIAVGMALRKAASVVGEMGSGLKKGLRGHEEAQPPKGGSAEMPSQRKEGEMVEKETPTREEKSYQETRRKENP